MAKGIMGMGRWSEMLKALYKQRLSSSKAKKLACVPQILGLKAAFILLYEKLHDELFPPGWTLQELEAHPAAWQHPSTLPWCFSESESVNLGVLASCHSK